MNKKSRKRKTHQHELEVASDELQQFEGRGSTQVPEPTGKGAVLESSPGRWLLSILFAGHFLAIFVALGSNLFQSRLQQNVMWGLSPYLVGTVQNYGTLAIELTHGEDFDFPLRFEYRAAEGASWRPLTSHGLSSVGRTRWPNLMRTIRFILEDDYESEVLSEFVFRVVQVALHEQEFEAVRVVQPFLPSFDEANMAANADLGLTDLGDDRILFEALVVRANGEVIGLNPIRDAYRSSAVSESDGEATGRLEVGSGL